MVWRERAGTDIVSLGTLAAAGLFTYSAWLTSIVFCASEGLRPLLIAGALFFPVGVVHGIGIWFGGW